MSNTTSTITPAFIYDDKFGTHTPALAGFANGTLDLVAVSLDGRKAPHGQVVVRGTALFSKLLESDFDLAISQHIDRCLYDEAISEHIDHLYDEAMAEDLLRTDDNNVLDEQAIYFYAASVNRPRGRVHYDGAITAPLIQSVDQYMQVRGLIAADGGVAPEEVTVHSFTLIGGTI